MSQQEEIENMILHESRSNLLISMFVKCPGIWLCFSFVLCIVLAIVAVSLDYLAINDMGERDFMQWKHKSTKHFDMMNMAW